MLCFMRTFTAQETLVIHRNVLHADDWWPKVTMSEETEINKNVINNMAFENIYLTK